MLEKEKYIKRVDRFRIKLDVNGTKLIKDIGYDFIEVCRNQGYKNRINEISKIATVTLDSDIDFIASWDLKDNQIFTEHGRKFIGEIKYLQIQFLAYYISKDRDFKYMKTVMNDIEKNIKYKNIMIFLEDFDRINKSNRYFIFGMDRCLLINPNNDNLDKMRFFQRIDIYEILKRIYDTNEILLSNWKKADYMLENKQYIIFMPFLDTEKLHKINIFYRNNKEVYRKIDILTLKENTNKINEILTKRTNIIEIDNCLEELDGEMEE